MPKISEEPALKPFWKTTDGKTVRLYLGDVIDVLKRLPSKIVHCCVTSPPYWGLRDYGTAYWDGGNDPSCNHKHENRGTVQILDRNGKPGSNNTNWQGAKNHSTVHLGGSCKKCGATRIDRQIGSEKTPEEFVEKMVEVFREVRRVLRDDGTLWLNLGDTYGNRGLVGAPWRVALALQADGWVLRQDIIWAKPAPMPESVRNRCTKAHDYVFLLTKSNKYFCDMEAIKTKAEPAERTVVEGGRAFNQNSVATFGGKPTGNSVPGSVVRTGNLANRRSVWTIFSQGYAGAHFATFPPKLIDPMIKAGTSEKGCCAKCGSPWRRVVEEKQLKRERPNEYVKYAEERGVKSGLNKDKGDGGRSNARRVNSCANMVAGVETKTVGWEAGCECNDRVVPCTVLDPFIGSGTSCVVSLSLGRRSVGIDLSEKYLSQNAIPRIEGAIYSRPALLYLLPRGGRQVEIGRKAKTTEF